MSGAPTARKNAALTRAEWDQALPGVMIVLDDIGLWLRPRIRHAGVFARQAGHRAACALREAWPAVTAASVKAGKAFLVVAPLALRDGHLLNLSAFWALELTFGGLWLVWELAGSGRRQVGRCRLRRSIGLTSRRPMVVLHEGTASDDLAPAVILNGKRIEGHDEDIAELWDVMAQICRQGGVPIPARAQQTELKLIKGGAA